MTDANSESDVVATRHDTGAGGSDGPWYVYSRTAQPALPPTSSADTAQRARPGLGSVRRRSVGPIVVAFEATALGVSFMLCAGFTWPVTLEHPALTVMTGTTFVLSALGVFALQGRYRSPWSRLAPASLVDTAVWLAFAGLAAAVIPVIAGADAYRLIPIAATAVAVAAIPMARAAALAVARRRTSTRRRNTLMIGMGRVARELGDTITSDSCIDMHVVAYADRTPPHGPDVAGNLHVAAELGDVLDAYAIEDIVVAFTPTKDVRLVDVVRRYGDRIDVWVVPRFFDVVGETHFSDVSRFPLLTLDSDSFRRLDPSGYDDDPGELHA